MAERKLLVCDECGSEKDVRHFDIPTGTHTRDESGNGYYNDYHRTDLCAACVTKRLAIAFGFANNVLGATELRQTPETPRK